MDSNPTPFPEIQPVKSKYSRKNTEPPTTKSNPKDPTTNRPKRVFGSTRDLNVPTKPKTEKPLTTKPSSRVLHKQPKSPQGLVKSPVENGLKTNKKSVCFAEEVGEISVTKSKESKVVAEPMTPVRSSPAVVIGTPYQSAERCSHCRFDRLETSSYWISQIKLAESVGKHFVSAAFFQLAFESHAEPIRFVRVELKKYLVRHGYLSNEPEWKSASRSYGLLKGDESNVSVVDSGSVKANTTDCVDEEIQGRELKN